MNQAQSPGHPVLSAAIAATSSIEPVPPTLQASPFIEVTESPTMADVLKTLDDKRQAAIAARNEAVQTLQNVMNTLMEMDL